MPIRTTKFLGVATGAIVSVLVAQGDQTRSLGPVAWGVDPNAGGDTIHLTPGTGQDGMAVTTAIHDQSLGTYGPKTLWLEASTTGSGVTSNVGGYDPQAHDIQWVWRFTRVGDLAWGLSGYTHVVHMPVSHNRRGIRYGKRTAHVLPPGDYEYICTGIVEANGRRATSATGTISIATPQSVFTAAQTFVVAEDNNFADAPANAGQFTSTSAGWSALAASSQPRGQLLIKRGTNFSGFGLTAPPQVREIYFGTWGNGAKPNMSSGRMSMWNLTNGPRYSVITENWQSIGPLDMVNPNSANVADAGNYFIQATGGDFTFYGVENRDTSGFISEFSGQSLNNRIAVCDCLVLGFDSSIALLEPHEGFAAIGNRFMPRENSLFMRNENQGGGFGMRGPSPRWLWITSQNDMFNRLGNLFSPGRPMFTQPMLRPGSGNSLVSGYHIFSDRNCIEGNSFFQCFVAGFNNTQERFTKRRGNIVVERNHYVATHDVFGSVSSSTLPGTFRCNIAIIPPNRPSDLSTNDEPNRFLGFSFQGGDGVFPAYEAGALGMPIQVYSNTCISYRDATSPPVFQADAQFTGVQTITNNLLHRPYSPSPLNVGAFVFAPIGTPRFNFGANWYNDTVPQPRTVTPTHFVELTGASGTFTESVDAEVTVTAAGLTGAQVAQVQGTGGTRRLWLKNVVGTIASGATVTVSSGGTGTASGNLQAINFMSLPAPGFAPGADGGRFSRVSFAGTLETVEFRGALPPVV